MNDTIDTHESADAGETVALHYRKYGDPAAPKLLILHGLFGAGANWRSIAGRLANRYEVFCLDLRNHGRSPWHDQMAYWSMAADVARFIISHGLHRPALLGHSMGGKVAMTLAGDARFAMELAGIMVVDIAPLAYPATRHLPLMNAMRDLDLTTLIDRKQIDTALARQIADPPTRQFLAQNLLKAPHGYRWRLNLTAIRRNRDTLSGYPAHRASTVDALFIAGAQSTYLQPAAHDAIHAHFPNARIATIANAGHWLHAEQPESVVELCREFLDGCVTGRVPG